MKVCVTGATGFIGAHVTAQLVAASHDVRVTVRDRARRRALVTSSVGALGPAVGGRSANERNPWPDDGTGLLYTDAKHEGELAALEAGELLELEVVSVNPAYVLGAALNRSLAGETSTRI